MAARQFHYAEDLSRTSRNVATAIDKLTLTFTPDASSDYWLFWSALADVEQQGIQNGVSVGFAENVGATTLAAQNVFQQDLSEIMAVGGIARHQEGVSPVSRTFAINFVGQTLGITGLQAASIVAVKADAADEYTEDLGLSSTTLNTYQNKATLTFTPASQGDYLIVFSADVSPTTAIAPDIRGFDGTTAYGEAQPIQETPTKDYPGFVTMVKLNLTAVSHTFNLQYRSPDGATSAAILRGRILAIRLDTLDNNLYAESRALDTASAVPVDKVTLVGKTERSAYLVLGVALLNHSSNSVGFNSHHLLHDELEFSIPGQRRPSAVANEMIWWLAMVRSFSRTQHELILRYAATGSTSAMSEAALALLQLETTPGSLVTANEGPSRNYFELTRGRADRGGILTTRRRGDVLTLIRRRLNLTAFRDLVISPFNYGNIAASSTSPTSFVTPANGRLAISHDAGLTAEGVTIQVPGGQDFTHPTLAADEVYRGNWVEKDKTVEIVRGTVGDAPAGTFTIYVLDADNIPREIATATFT